jgi:hypothetical protein
MNFLVTIYVKKRKLIVVVVRHYVCKPKFWFGGLVTKWEGIRHPICPIYIGPLILKMAKHIVMSMHVCVCCANKLILIVRVVIMLVAI